MNEQADSDLQAELAAMRQRLSKLEAEHREFLGHGGSLRRRRLSGKLLLSALAAALLLVTGGWLFAQTGADALFINAKGWVGIGTNTPKAPLDIQQEPRTDAKNHPDSVTVLYVTGDLDEDSGIEFRHSNGWQGIGFGYNTIYATGAYKDQNLNIRAQPNGTVKLQEGLEVRPDRNVIMNDGNVGIGTGSPGAKLDVAGTARLGKDIAESWLPHIDNKAYISGTQTIIRSSQSGNYAEFVRIDEKGNVGIGTNTPAAKLDVTGDLKVTGKVTAPGMITGSVFMIMNNTSSTSLSCSSWGTGQCQIGNYCRDAQPVTIWSGYCSEYNVTSDGHCYAFLCVSK